MSQETKMDQVTTEMIEHVCDNVCVHAFNDEITQEELEDICVDCEMGKFVCDILNTYNADKKQEWIPVTERLPKGNGKYQGGVFTVTIVEKNTGRVETSYVPFDYKAKKWLINHWSVIAWMPLPKPYKEV